MNPCQFFKCLADDTRLHILLLLASESEACVCDLMNALALDQPKISRHLAGLRNCAIVQGNRRGKWVFYKLHPELPDWASAIIRDTAIENTTYFESALKKFRSGRIDSNACC